MRKIKDMQLQLAGTAIENIRFNLKSRDDIPAILIGLQHIYTDSKTRQQLFTETYSLMNKPVSRID